MKTVILSLLAVLIALLANETNKRYVEVIHLKQQIKIQTDLNKKLSDQLVKCETRYLTRCKCPEED